MKVFLGWSGETSHNVALALNDWLPKVIQAVKPFVSSEDIAKGARWSTEIAKELLASNYGIICVTRDNSGSAWINFEAGALSKEIQNSLVAPFLFDLRSAEIDGPLAQFQMVTNEKGDILKLLGSINAALGENKLEDENLKTAFEMWWPKFEDELARILRDQGSKPTPQKRPVEEMVEELLELARVQQRDTKLTIDALGTHVAMLELQVQRLQTDLSPLASKGFYDALYNTGKEAGSKMSLSDLSGLGPPPPSRNSLRDRLEYVAPVPPPPKE